MILAKISEGLIGSEGAIYPCPKGQGVIAKSWVLNDKNVDNYLNSLIATPSNLLVLYLRMRKAIMISIFLQNALIIYNLFFMDFIISAYEFILFGNILSFFIILIFAKIPFSRIIEPSLLLTASLIIILTSFPFFSILIFIGFFICDDRDFKNCDFNNFESNDSNKQEYLFLKIVNNDDECLTQLLSKNELNIIEKELIEKVLSVKKPDKNSIETLKNIIYNENKNKLYVEND